MKEHEAFIRQARSDYTVFRLLLNQNRELIPACHPLHYLQMTSEKLAKAILIASGNPNFDRYSHAVFSMLPVHLHRREIAGKLQWKNFKAFHIVRD